MKKKVIEKLEVECEITLWENGWKNGLKAGAGTVYQGRMTEKHFDKLCGLLEIILPNKKIRNHS